MPASGLVGKVGGPHKEEREENNEYKLYFFLRETRVEPKSIFLFTFSSDERRAEESLEALLGGQQKKIREGVGAKEQVRGQLRRKKMFSPPPREFASFDTLCLRSCWDFFAILANSAAGRIFLYPGPPSSGLLRTA